MPHVLLINPNISEATTARMVEIAREHLAREHLAAELTIAGLTAPFGAPLIIDAAGLATARAAVLALVPQIEQAAPSAVIVAAFGDPGLEELRARLQVPVVGIGEAGLVGAAAAGDPFAVVTTTPGLVAAIDGKVAGLGLAGRYGGVVLTEAEPIALTADAVRLEAALAGAIEEAIARRGARAVVIGGGPLAVAARALAARLPIPVVEPIPAAVRAVERALLGTPSRGAA